MYYRINKCGDTITRSKEVDFMAKKEKRAHINVRIEAKLLRTLDSQRNGSTRTRLIEDAVRLYLAAGNSDAPQQKSA